jgi:hypothetical protein
MIKQTLFVLSLVFINGCAAQWQVNAQYHSQITSCIGNNPCTKQTDNKAFETHGSASLQPVPNVSIPVTINNGTVQNNSREQIQVPMGYTQQFGHIVNHGNGYRTSFEQQAIHKSL